MIRLATQQRPHPHMLIQTLTPATLINYVYQGWGQLLFTNYLKLSFQNTCIGILDQIELGEYASNTSKMVHVCAGYMPLLPQNVSFYPYQIPL